MYSSYYKRGFLIATVGILGYALLKILEPFWGALGWAAVLAFLLYPLHLRLTRRLERRQRAGKAKVAKDKDGKVRAVKSRAGVSAGIITGLTPFCILLPLVALGVVFARQGANLIEYLRGRTFITYPALLAQLESYPVIGPALRWIRENAAITAEQLQNWVTSGVQSLLKGAAAMSGTFVLGFVGTLVGFFLMLFLLFFLLRDGRAMIAHMARLIPMETERRNALVTYLGEVTRAVVYGSALTALIQGTLVGVGFAIAGLPAPVVFGVLAGLTAFIPAAGTGVVLVPAVLYLVIVGRWGPAIFLGVWSLLVGSSDNILRPVLTAQRADVSTLAVFVGVIGGVATFGLVGLIIGPVLLSLIVALLRFAEETVP